jgi:hypothetical protein
MFWHGRGLISLGSCVFLGMEVHAGNCATSAPGRFWKTRGVPPARSINELSGPGARKTGIHAQTIKPQIENAMSCQTLDTKENAKNGTFVAFGALITHPAGHTPPDPLSSSLLAPISISLCPSPGARHVPHIRDRR